jgi:hypothetical protein
MEPRCNMSISQSLPSLDGKGRRPIPAALKDFMLSKQKQFWTNMLTSSIAGICLTFLILHLFNHLSVETIMSCAKSFGLSLLVTLVLSATS